MFEAVVVVNAFKHCLLFLTLEEEEVGALRLASANDFRILYHDSWISPILIW